MRSTPSVQFNARVSEETMQKFNELVDYYDQITPVGKITKSEVLKDIINKTHDLMQKQKQKTPASRSHSS